MKSRHARAPRSLPWQRYLLDFVLLGVAGYAFVSFRQRRTIQELIPAESAPLDPLLFLASTAFILGAGLLTLRLFPIAVRLAFRLGRRLWSPAVYAGLVQVSRSRGREYFAMIFLILTLGVGLASSTTARTINRSAEDDISYQVGADLALLPEFQSDAPPENVDLLDPLAAPAAPTGSAPAVQYRAPPLGPFRALPGVERLTTVFRAPSASMVIPGSNRVALQVMAVVPHEFGRITWFRNDLLPAHINHHLNLIADHPTGILLSADVRDRGVRLGDLVRLTWETATADPGDRAGLRRLLAVIRPERRRQGPLAHVRGGKLRLRVREDGHGAVRAVDGPGAGRAERPALRRSREAGAARPGDPGHRSDHHRGQERPTPAGHPTACSPSDSSPPCW